MIQTVTIRDLIPPEVAAYMQSPAWNRQLNQNAERINRIYPQSDQAFFEAWYQELIYPTPDKDMPEAVRLWFQAQLPGIDLVCNTDGTIRRVILQSLQEFSAFCIARQHIHRLYGAVRGWSDNGDLLCGKTDIVATIARLIPDAIKPDSAKMNKVWDLVQRAAPAVNFDTADTFYTAFDNGLLNTTTGDFIQDRESKPFCFMIPQTYTPGVVPDKTSEAYDIIKNLADNDTHAFSQLLELLAAIISSDTTRYALPVIVTDNTDAYDYLIDLLTRILNPNNVLHTTINNLSSVLQKGHLYTKPLFVCDAPLDDTIPWKYAGHLKHIGAHEPWTVTNNTLATENAFIFPTLLITCKRCDKHNIDRNDAKLHGRLAYISITDDISRLPAIDDISDSTVADIVQLGIEIGLPRLKDNNWRIEPNAASH